MEKPILPDYLGNARVVLCRPSHPSNIGAAARAMKTMGLTRMVLVSPKLIPTPMTPHPPVFDPENPAAFKLPEESHILSSNADDVLDAAPVFADLREALADVSVAFGTTSKKRSVTRDLQQPREACPEIVSRLRAGERVALVFGNETNGLSIEELGQCNRLVTINGNPDYMSLNLSQAVQVMTYELFTHVGESSPNYLKTKETLADQKMVYGLVEHMRAVMERVGYFNRRSPDLLMRRVKRLFDKAALETHEIDVMRGFLKTVSARLDHLERKAGETGLRATPPAGAKAPGAASPSGCARIEAEKGEP